jgi:hypothetical protein
MNRQSKIALSIAATLIVSTAIGLSRLQALQRLGTPGVKLIERPVYREDGAAIGTNAVALPEHVLNFESREQPIAKVVWNWLPKDTTYAQRMYRAPDGFLTTANVVLMGTDRTSIHDPKYCLAGQGFETVKEEFDSVPIQEPHPYSLPVYKWTVRREATTPEGVKVPQSALYVFWFVADGQLTANHKERMWWMARDLVTRGVLQRWAYVSCFSACAPGQEEAAYARMREWIAAAVPQFQLATGPSAPRPFPEQ